MSTIKGMLVGTMLVLVGCSTTDLQEVVKPVNEAQKTIIRNQEEIKKGIAAVQEKQTQLMDVMGQIKQVPSEIAQELDKAVKDLNDSTRDILVETVTGPVNEVRDEVMDIPSRVHQYICTKGCALE